MTHIPEPLAVTFDSTDLFDLALKEESDRGRHSKCYMGNKAKVAGPESGDPRWRAPRAKFMPERGVVNFDYDRSRYEQDLSRAEIRWLTKFDLGEALRTRTFLLDPNGPRTRLLHVVGAANGTHRRTTPTVKAAPKTVHANTSVTPPAGPARKTVHVNASVSESDDVAAPIAPAVQGKNFGGPDRKGRTTAGCDSNYGPQEKRARRMRLLIRRRLEKQPASA